MKIPWWIFKNFSISTEC